MRKDLAISSNNESRVLTKHDNNNKLHLQGIYKQIKSNTSTYVDRVNAKKTDVTRLPITSTHCTKTKRSTDNEILKPVYRKHSLSTETTHVLTANKKCDRKKDRGTIIISTDPKKSYIPKTIPPGQKCNTVTSRPSNLGLKLELNHGPKNNPITDVTKEFTNQQNKKFNTGKQKIPTRHEIYNNSAFGKTSRNHSFTSEASFEQVLIFVIKGTYLSNEDKNKLLNCHALFKHLNRMIDWSKHIEIMSLKEHIHNYAD